jgi:hypothetical protein
MNTTNHTQDIDNQSDEEFEIVRNFPESDDETEKKKDTYCGGIVVDNTGALTIIERIPPIIPDRDYSLYTNNEKALYFELVENQLKHIYPPNLRLSRDDISRIVKRIETSIFDPNQCCIWRGATTNKNKNGGKNAYGSLFFDKKKHGVHRLIYANYVGQIPNERTTIKRICSNKVKCQNVNHLLACTKQKIK